MDAQQQSGSYPEKRMALVQSAGNLNANMIRNASFNQEKIKDGSFTGNWIKEQIVEEEQEQSQHTLKIKLLFDRYDQTGQGILGQAELQQLAQDEKIKLNIEYVEEVNFEQFKQLFVEDEQYQDLIFTFFGKNQLLCYQNGKLSIFNTKSSTNFYNIVDEQDVINLRLQYGFKFNAYNNAKSTYNLLKLKQSYDQKSLPPMVHEICWNSDIWEYLNEIEKSKDNQNSKHQNDSSNIKINLLPGWNNRSGTITNLGSERTSFIYQPTQGNIENGLLRIDEQDCEIYSIYNHLVYENQERKDCIAMAGWEKIAFKNANLTLCDRLEKEGQYLRAAAVSLCHFDFARGFEYFKKAKSDVMLTELLQGLKNIGDVINEDTEMKQCFYLKVNKPSDQFQDPGFDKIIQQEDLDRMVETQLFAQQFDKHEFMKIDSKRVRYELIKKNLQWMSQLLNGCGYEDPYLNLIANFIQGKNFEKYLKGIYNSEISSFDKVGLWNRFCNKNDLKEIIKKGQEKAKEEGLIEWIIFLGKSAESVEIVQSYLDRTGDIQLAGTIAGHMISQDYDQKRVLQEMVIEYKQLLNRTEQFEERAEWEIEEKKLSRDNQGKQRVGLGCNYCKKSIGQQNIESNKRTIMRKNQMQNNNRQDQKELNICPNCNHPLPKCSVCVRLMSIPNIFLEEMNKQRKQTKQKSNDSISINNAYLWCQSCKHGGHYQHLREWFELYNQCAVGDCQCQCAII